MTMREARLEVDGEPVAEGGAGGLARARRRVGPARGGRDGTARALLRVDGRETAGAARGERGGDAAHASPPARGYVRRTSEREEVCVS